MLAPLFEDLAKSGGQGNAGKWFDQAKMGKFVTFLSALLCAALENWTEYEDFCRAFPDLRMLIEVHLPLVFLTITLPSVCWGVLRLKTARGRCASSTKSSCPSSASISKCWAVLNIQR